ncbi:hypothetical protein EN45_024130 [Penicillium chrysogenum]|uniref:Uncharacterized protein n=1 Tax=Penicillium chrysogenum TaxID=5076 RepID=A0A167X040_PENCH|nr:hypothetical protein EN45_024130 [Penicillium chrysogenum]
MLPGAMSKPRRWRRSSRRTDFD